ncbi:hypothetical protein NLO98_01685 [Pseudomonas syringae]|nr:hypothetical protein [Pseudomonas syringae]
MSHEMQLHVVASLLRRGKALDNLSTGLTLLSLAFGLIQLLITGVHPFLLILAVSVTILGLLEKYYAIRVAFDADLFHVIASDPQWPTDRTAALDDALIKLGLQPVDKAGRAWSVRSQGALRLLRQQLLFLAIQLLVLLSAVVIFPWLSFTS